MDGFMWVEPQYFAKRKELYHIETPLPVLVLCHKRLRPAQALCQLILCQSGIVSGVHQNRDQSTVSRGVDGLHKRAPKEKKPAPPLNPFPDYPKIGYCSLPFPWLMTTPL